MRLPYSLGMICEVKMDSFEKWRGELTDGKLQAVSLVAWLAVSAYALTLFPGERQAWRDAVAAFDGAPAEYVLVAHVRAFFEHGSRVFILLSFVAGGAGFHVYRWLERVSRGRVAGVLR